MITDKILIVYSDKEPTIVLSTEIQPQRESALQLLNQPQHRGRNGSSRFT